MLNTVDTGTDKTARPIISRSSGLWWSDKERKTNYQGDRVSNRKRREGSEFPRSMQG